MIYVFDSSAMLAYLNDESGADVVEQLLAESGATKYAHAVNLCEVFYDFLRRSDAVTAENAIADLKKIGVEECNDMDAMF